MELSKDYLSWLYELKSRIQNAQIKAALSVNAELLMLYWDLGREIVEKEKASGYGSRLIPRLSKDLLDTFPEMKGFSATNLGYIKRWFLFYNSESADTISPQPVAKLEEDKTQPALGFGKQSGSISPQVVGPLMEVAKTEREGMLQFVQQLVAQIPWGHNREIITKCASVDEALFYTRETIRNNWSRNVLVLQIQSGLYGRQGKSITNFEATLPKPQSDLARELLKNPYNFDFLTLGKEAQERDIEDALVEHITKFLLELGQGFAYLGRQYKLKLEEDEYFLDLLFYHTRLHCYVVIELKADEFKPEYAGKLNFYLNLVDDLVRAADDKPSIGMLLCREAGKLRVEYALRNINRPIGVSEYQLTEALPENLKGRLPTIEEIEAELNPE